MTHDNDDPGFPLSGPRFNAFVAHCALMQTNHFCIRRVPQASNRTFRVWAVDPVVHCKIYYKKQPTKCSYIKMEGVI